MRFGEMGRKHMRLFPKKADSEGKLRRWQWLDNKRWMNYHRTYVEAGRLGITRPRVPI
jgi:hypothetical protein